MARVTDNAVCIRHIDWSETSQVVALFTEQHGKLRGLAKGSKRTSPGAIARFSGGIELLTRGQVVATIKQTTDLAAITEWDLQDPYRHLRTDLEAHHLGMYVADLAGALTIEHDAHPKVYAALVRVLEELGKPQAAERGAALLRFQWALLVDCGYKPQLGADARTGEVIGAEPNGQPVWFDALAGGLTLDGDDGYQGRSRGRVTDVGPWRVRPETVTLLRGLSGNTDATLSDATPAAVTRANRLLCVYARALLDRQLPTMGFVLKERR